MITKNTSLVKEMQDLIRKTATVKNYTNTDDYQKDLQKIIAIRQELYNQTPIISVGENKMAEEQAVKTEKIEKPVKAVKTEKKAPRAGTKKEKAWTEFASIKDSKEIPSVAEKVGIKVSTARSWYNIYKKG